MGLKRLTQSMDDLKIRRDDILLLACNTAHLLLPEIEAAYGVRFISIVDTTVESIQQTGVTRVGLLASPTTIHSKLYEKPLVEVGCDVLAPTAEDIEILEQAIRHVIANGSPDRVRILVEPIIERMTQEGAQKIILGCTELSVIFRNSKNERLIDPLTTICEKVFVL